MFFYVNGLHLHEALKFSSWFTSSFCHKDTLKVSFFVSFQFWRTSWYGTPCSCHFIFFSSKQLAIFLLLVFVYLISPSMILVVYNANVFLVVAFFKQCWSSLLRDTLLLFAFFLTVLIVIFRAWCILHHHWCSGSFIALAIPFYAFCCVLFLLVFCFFIFFVFVIVNLSMVPCV